jgi:hypothetical protein
MVLAVEDIPAYLDNAALVTWFWQYSNLTGGAKVNVSSLDAERATDVLWPEREADPVALPPWQCVKCGEHVDASWKICWHCGASTDGEEARNFFEPPAVLEFPLKGSPVAWSIMVGASGPLLFLVSHGSMRLLGVWFVAVVVMLTLRGWWPADQGSTASEVEMPELNTDAIASEITEQTAEEGYTVIEETVLRAWQAAVLSLWFLPLAFYAVWLLLQLDLADGPLAPTERRRYLGAWAFIIAKLTWWIPWILLLMR